MERTFVFVSNSGLDEIIIKAKNENIAWQKLGKKVADISIYHLQSAQG